jgi:hypothetical protein
MCAEGCDYFEVKCNHSILLSVTFVICKSFDVFPHDGISLVKYEVHSGCF